MGGRTKKDSTCHKYTLSKIVVNLLGKVLNTLSLFKQKKLSNIQGEKKMTSKEKEAIELVRKGMSVEKAAEVAGISSYWLSLVTGGN